MTKPTKILRSNSSLNVGKFATRNTVIARGWSDLPGVRYPLFNADDQLFDTVEGLVLVLTHECDIDQDNNRPFNDYLVFCPIIPLADFLAEYTAHFSDEIKLKSFLSNVAARNVSRLMYVPPGLKGLEYGGLMYLNQISNSHISGFAQESSKRLGSVSSLWAYTTGQPLIQSSLAPESGPTCGLLETT